MKYTLWETRQHCFWTSFQFLSPCWLAGVWMGSHHYADYQLPLSLTTLPTTALWPLHTLRQHRNAGVRLHNCVRHCARAACTSWCGALCARHFSVCAVDGEAAKRKHISNSLWWPPPPPPPRHYSLELLLAQHTVRTPTICNTRWCHRHFWHVLHRVHWYTNCDGLDTSVYRGVYDMSIACSTFWTTL